MQSFSIIYEEAITLSGGEKKLKERLPDVRSADEIRQLSDAYCLSQMSIRIFQAGLNQKMIINKWPAFEEVFKGFDIYTVRMMSDEALEALMHERRIVRHWGKIQSVRHNAETIHQIREEAGSFANFLADWPTNNIVTLWSVFKKRFKQLGGASGPYFLRRIRKDTFLLTDDVIRALGRWGAIDFIPKNQNQLKQVQDIMNQWHEESQLPYSHLSKMLASSIN